jgi:hypothetical protein
MPSRSPPEHDEWQHDGERIWPESKRCDRKSREAWAAMPKRHRGRQWHCRTIRTFNLDYARLPQATQWPDGRNKLTRQWLGYDNSIPRYVFPASKTWWALIGVLKTSRDMKKDCGEPGCPNDHRSRFSPVATRIE